MCASGCVACVQLVRLTLPPSADLGLSDSMSARHGLNVSLRIKVGVENNDCVSGSEIDADATSTTKDTSMQTQSAAHR